MTLEAKPLQLHVSEESTVPSDFLKGRFETPFADSVFEEVLTSGHFEAVIVPQTEKGILTADKLKRNVLFALDYRSPKFKNSDSEIFKAYLNLEGTVPQFAWDTLSLALSNNSDQLQQFSYVTAGLSMLTVEGFRADKFNTYPEHRLLYEQYFQDLREAVQQDQESNYEWLKNSDSVNEIWETVVDLSCVFLNNTLLKGVDTVSEKDLIQSYSDGIIYHFRPHAVSYVIGKTGVFEPESVVSLVQEYKDKYL